MNYVYITEKEVILEDVSKTEKLSQYSTSI